MSKQQFNEFLIDKLLTWFEKNIKVGIKYRFYSDNEEYLLSLVKALNPLATGTLSFIDTEVKYLEVKGIKLVFVNDVDESLNENNIATLRDEFSEDGHFRNSALLIIHKSQLDTILSASTELTLPGYPLSAEAVKKDINNLVQKNRTKKNLFEYLLNSQTAIIEEDQQSAFGYEVLFESIIEDKVDFNAFGLFEDPDLYNLESSSVKIEKSLKENEELFRKVKSTVNDFPNEIKEKLPELSPEFIRNSVTVENWETNTFGSLKVEMQNTKGQSVLFDEQSIIYKSTDLKRSENDTPSGNRTKNIIIFAEDDKLDLTFKLIGEHINKDNFYVSNNKTIEQHHTVDYKKRKNIFRYTLSFDYDSTPTYFTLTFKGRKSSDKHTFKVLVLQKDSFYFGDIETNFIVNPRTEFILLQLDNFKIRFNPDANSSMTTLTDKTDLIDINTYHSLDFEDYYNKNDDVSFSINNNESRLDFQVEGSKEENKISIPFLLNPTMLGKLFHNNKDIEFNSSKNKAIIDNREFKLVSERLVYVKWEHEFIEKKLFSSTTKDASLVELKNIDETIYTSYEALLNYFSEHKTTPSLCAWNDEVCALAEQFVDAYLIYMQKVEEDLTLDESVKTLFEFGFVTRDNRKMMSPFSPLILSYIIYLVKEAKNDGSFKDISEVTLDRLNVKGLFPYLFVDKDQYAFTQVAKGDALWLEFVLNEDTEFSYVKKLTYEKIEEFISSFKEIFKSQAPLIINSINNHKNEELFEGIFKYYKNNFSKHPKKIVINLYDESYIETAFDIFADTDKYDKLKEKYNLKVDAETIIDTVRTHITYSKQLIGENQAYCHLSFFKNNEKVVIQDRTIEQSRSGLVSKGLISGESSQKDRGNYYSGFGLKNIDVTDLKHLALAKIYNAMQRPVYDDINYESKKTISLRISERFKTILKQSYDNALWTVIIDPKVTLEFFDNSDELILIHFSDQYSSSANYDAVTVTAQKELYVNVVAHTGNSEDKENIVKQFNAFNGEWLIKMISENEKTKKERVSIISAYKYITALLDDGNITWVPMSVAEMIRVSGNVGLSMSGSDFTRYNENLTKGAISDDILLVGFRNDEVILYPVEVKSNHGNMTKAKEQAEALKGFFYERLFKGDTFKSRLLKGLFIRQVFMQVEKYELYNIFGDNYFKKLHEQRETLLEGTYTLATLEEHSEGAVLAFLESEHDTRVKKIDNILEIKLPFELQSIMLSLSYSDMKQSLAAGRFGTNYKYMLSEVSTETIAPDLENISVDTLEIEEDIENEITVEMNEEIVSSSLLEIKFGEHNLSNDDIFWHPTNTAENQNTCTGIIGKSGTGKTQFTKSLITQLVNQSPNNVDGLKIDMLIFDYKNDYTDDDFVEATGSTTLKPFHLPYNPFALFGNQDLLPIHAANLFVTIIAKAFNLGQVQKVKLDDIIMLAYERKGISPYDEETWTNIAPTMQDVWEVFEEDEKAPVDSLYAALKKIQKFQIFEPKAEKTRPLYDAIDGVTVIKLSGYDTDLQNLIVAITLDLFHTQMHIKGSSVKTNGLQQITKMILVDEADNFMSQNFESLKKILKEGREFGVGTILSTQELTHFKTGENDYASYIFTWIIHKVSSIKRQDVQSIFNIGTTSEAENIMSQVRELQKHYSFYVDGNKKVTLMRDLAFFELMEQTNDSN